MFAFLSVMERKANSYLGGRSSMIRALGPGSVSSFLKVILDVFYVFLWLIGVLLAVLIFGAVLISFDPQLIPQSVMRTLQGGRQTFASATVSVVAGETQAVFVLIV